MNEWIICSSHFQPALCWDNSSSCPQKGSQLQGSETKSTKDDKEAGWVLSQELKCWCEAAQGWGEWGCARLPKVVEWELSPEGEPPGEQGCRGTWPTPGSLAGQAAALLELLCSPLFVKSSLYCPLCYIPVKSDLIILLFRSLHDLRYSVKVLINL